jgi:hypothetical protein
MDVFVFAGMTFPESTSAIERRYANRHAGCGDVACGDGRMALEMLLTLVS